MACCPDGYIDVSMRRGKQSQCSDGYGAMEISNKRRGPQVRTAEQKAAKQLRESTDEQKAAKRLRNSKRVRTNEQKAA